MIGSKRGRAEYESDLSPPDELEIQLRQLRRCVRSAEDKLERRHQILSRQVPPSGVQVCPKVGLEDLTDFFRARYNRAYSYPTRSRTDFTFTPTTEYLRNAETHNASQLTTGSAKNALSILTQEANLYPIYQCLLNELEIVDIIALTRTCKALSGLYRRLIQTVWDINVYLGGWFQDPRGIRALADSVGAVIGGSAIFDFMNRRQRDDAILEFFGTFEPDEPEDIQSRVYPPHWPYGSVPNHVLTLTKVLTETEGYKLVPWESDARFGDSDVCRGYKTYDAYNHSLGLVKSAGNENKRITISWQQHWRCQDGLLGMMKSTASCNWLFWDRCIAVFPNATFRERVAYPTRGTWAVSPARGDDSTEYASHGAPGLDFKAYCSRGLHLCPETIIAGTTEWLDGVWQKSRRIAGPEAWVISCEPPRVRTGSRPRVPMSFLDTAYMTMEVKTDWTRWPASRDPNILHPIHQYVSLNTSTDYLATLRHPTWHGRSSEGDELFISDVWNSVLQSYFKYDCMQRFHKLPLELRPVRRSTRLSSLGNSSETWNAMYFLFDPLRWPPPKGTDWYNNDGLEELWSVFLTRVGRFERNEYRGKIQSLPGLM